MVLKSIKIKDLRISFRYEKDYIQDYIKHTNDGILKRNKDLDISFKKDLSDDQENESIIRRIYLEDFAKFPSFSNHSQIVMIYSLLENTMITICEKVKADIELKISVTDFNMRDIFGASVTYLEKTLDIDFRKSNHNWQNIQDYKKIRNAIVHDNSTYKNSNEKRSIKLLNDSINCIYDSYSGKFFITNSICVLNFLELVSELINDVLNQIGSKEILPMVIQQNIHFKNEEDYHNSDDDMPF